MMEIWDAYDRDGNKLGVNLVRGEPVPEGMYHLVCEIILRHRNGNFLMTLRDPNKPIHPGEWELGAGGSALKGEDALTGAKRELFEETGIRAEVFIPLTVLVREENRCIFHLFYAETGCDPDSVVLQAGETVDYRWVSREELEDLLDKNLGAHSTKERYLAKNGIDSLPALDGRG